MRYSGSLLIGMLLLVVVLMLFPMGMHYSAHYDAYSGLQDEAETVLAEITRVETRTFADVRPAEYQLYVTYTYGGTTYEDVQYTVSNDQVLPGASVHVQVDPEHPEQLRPLTDGSPDMSLMLLLLVPAGVFCVLQLGRYLAENLAARDWSKVYARRVVNRQTVQADLDGVKRHLVRVRSLLCGLLLLAALGCGVVHYVRQGTYTALWMIGAPVLLILLLLTLLLALLKRKRARADAAFVIAEDKLIAARDEEEDGVKAVRWRFARSGTWTWDRNVFVTLQDEAADQPGGHYILVRNGRGRLIRLYSAEEFRVE